MEYKYLISRQDFISYKTFSDNVDYDKKMKPFVKEAQDMDLKQAIGYPLFFDLLSKYGTEPASVDFSNYFGSGLNPNDKIINNLGGTATVLTNNGTTLTLSEVHGDWVLASTINVVNDTYKADISNIILGAYYKLVNGDVYTDYLGYYYQFEGLKSALAYWSFARFLERGNDYSTATGFVVKLTPESQPLSREEVSDKITQAKSGAISYWNEVEKYLYDMYVLNQNLFPLYAKTLYLKHKKKGGIRLSKVSKFDRESEIKIKNRGEVDGNGYCSGEMKI